MNLMAIEQDLTEMELFEKISMREQIKKELADQHGPIREALHAVKYKLAILSGKGGVGKTSAVINIASALKKMGFSVGVFDADVHGPSVPKMIGLGRQNNTRGASKQEKTQCASENSGRIQVHCKRSEMKNHMLPMPDQMSDDHSHRMKCAPNDIDRMQGAWGMSPAETENGIKVMSVSLFWPGEATPIMWKGHYKARVIRQLLAAVKWGRLDFLLIDLPPGTGDEPTTIMKSIPGLNGMVLVTSPQEISVNVCSKAISSANELGAPLLGLIENMTDFCCPHCGKDIAILGQGRGEDLARTYKIPFLGRIPLNELAGKAADEGVPVVVQYPDSLVSRAYWRITHGLLDILTQEEE
jgi:ATP-binding protein involved in chromosome partitioning